MQTPLILVINLGGTSSKFALFRGDEELCQKSLPVADEHVRLSLTEQRPHRVDSLKEFIEQENINLADLAAVAARSGIVRPVSERGVYRVGDVLMDDLASERYGSHPSNLSSLIAIDLISEKGLDIPVYVVDPITVDMMWDEARYSGVPEIERCSRFHALNIFRAIRHACEHILDVPPHAQNYVVGHFGSGMSCATVVKGRVVDVNDALLGEGPFSVSRAGVLPIRGVLDLYDKFGDRKKLETYLSKQAGMAAYTGTADFREVERRIDHGDPVALKTYRAMVYQSVKYLAAHAGVIGKHPDHFILTGGMMFSERFARDLTHKLEWMAPVIVLPGEDELAALAEGVHRAIRGFEPIHVYATMEDPQAFPPRSMQEVINRSSAGVDCDFVVVGGHHPVIPETIKHCHEFGISGFVLVGPEAETRKLLEEGGVELEMVKLIDAAEDDIVTVAMDHVAKMKNGALVKGKCDTKKLLSAVLKSLPDEQRPFLSHVAFVESPGTNKLVAITDGGLNIELDVEKKIRIMKNALLTVRALGVNRPRIALVAGMEDKGQDFPAIADAREIVKLHKEEGAFPCSIIDGPFGVDVALMAEAAALKGIQTEVAGVADIIVCPNLESCNVGIKMTAVATGNPWAGLVVGGPVPIVLGSRSDDAMTRTCSIAMAQLVAGGRVAHCDKDNEECRALPAEYRCSD
jgi:butyrate kinase